MAMCPVSLDEIDDHGTPISVLVGGKTLGTAPKADLYLIKLWNCIEITDPATNQVEKFTVSPTQFALAAATDRIEKVVRSRNLHGKAVLIMSFGRCLPH